LSRFGWSSLGASNMSNVRIPKAVCSAVAEVLSGSHKTLDNIFEAAGAPGPPPDLPHQAKWKEWLFRSGLDSTVDSLALVGTLIEEFMDLPPVPMPQKVDFFGMTDDPVTDYQRKRDRLVSVLEENGFRYFRGGRVLPIREADLTTGGKMPPIPKDDEPSRPTSVEELLQTIIRGLPRAMYPLTHRRKGATALAIESEHDIQDVLHSLLRPWIADLRPEEFTPSYGGSSTRMDFLLPKHSFVLETKRIRD
jgi:hypothetical protein